MKMCQARKTDTGRWFDGFAFSKAAMDSTATFSMSIEDGHSLQRLYKNVELVEFCVVTQEEQAVADKVACKFFMSLIAGEA